MLDIKVTGIQKAIRAINQSKITLKDKMKIVVERLAEEGFAIARYAFQTALYAGENDVVVNEPVWRDDNTIVITAEGNAVAFIEFGSGKFYEDYPTDIPGEATDPSALGVVPHGEYGKKKGASPPWTYVGEPGNVGMVIHEKSDGKSVVKTLGNPPARAMYQASIQIADKQRAIEIAKEVFGND